MRYFLHPSKNERIYHYARYPTGMPDSSSLDKALDLAFSLASVSFEAAFREVQLLSFLKGAKSEMIVASISGLITFILTLMVVSNLRRPRHEVPKAWPSQGSGLNKVPEAPSHVTIMTRIFEAPQHVEKQLELTDHLREQLQKKLLEASSEPRRRDVALCRHDNSWHLWRAVYSPVMKLAGDFLISSTTQVTALIDRAVSHVQARRSSFSTARTKSRCSCSCDWQRVAREGWTDYVLGCLGWYPWQCKHCLTCSHFRSRWET